MEVVWKLKFAKIQCSCCPKLVTSFWQIGYFEVNIGYDPLFYELMQVYLTALIGRDVSQRLLYGIRGQERLLSH